MKHFGEDILIIIPKKWDNFVGNSCDAAAPMLE